MFRILTVLAALILLTAGGCTFQANNASEAVTVNPLYVGSGQSVFSPANGPGYINGEAQDMRRR
jgi:hypothetical protein